MKKIIVLLLAFAMLLSLVACGGQTVEEDATDEPQSEQEVVVGEGEEKEVTPAPDVAQEKESDAAEAEQDEPVADDAIETSEQEKEQAQEEEISPVQEKKETPVTDTSDSNSNDLVVPEQPAHQHSYTTSVTPATCTTKGYTTYSCDCGHSYTANHNGGSGHKYEEVYENLPVYEKVPIMRCGGCHANLDEVGGVAHIKEEALAGTGGSSYSDVDYVIVGYEDQLVGYACSVCGAER